MRCQLWQYVKNVNKNNNYFNFGGLGIFPPLLPHQNTNNTIPNAGL